MIVPLFFMPETPKRSAAEKADKKERFFPISPKIQKYRIDKSAGIVYNKTDKEKTFLYFYHTIVKQKNKISR